MNTNIYTKVTAPVIAAVIAMISSFAQADIVLYPGYISGTFSIGEYNVYSANISASGGSYASTKSISDDAASLSIPYTLTVQGGDWDYNVNASANMREASGSYYPYTYMTFNQRKFPVAIGETRTNDYNYTPGIVRFEVNITGDAYSSWYAYGYATKTMSPPAEKTYSQGYTHSSYTPEGKWNMPVIPNDQIRIYASVRVDNKTYSFWTARTDYRYEDIAAGQTLVIPLDVVHEALDPPEPPTYDYGSVAGSINLELNEPERFMRHRVTGYGSRYLYYNPDSYLFEFVRTGIRTFRAQTWFDDYRTYLQWPYTDGDYLNDRIDVAKGVTYTKDFHGQTGRLEGELLYSGTLGNQDLNSYSLSAQGAGGYFDPVAGVWIYPATYGGSASITKYGTDTDSDGVPDNRYRLLLSPGPWMPYRLNASSSNSDNGYNTNFSLNITDYNYYYDYRTGSYYDFGQPANITGGSLVQQDREYCMGSVVVRFRDDDGGLLSSPSVSGSGNRNNDTGNRELYASVSGSSGVRDVLQPEVEVHGPPGDYNLSNLRIITQDDSRITFPSFPIALECGVRKGVPSSGVPKIVIAHPPAYLITAAETVSVNGTAADDTGIAGVTINGVAVDATATGNPDNEVSFSYPFVLNPGTNTIRTEVVDPQGNLSYDERDIYAERWPPTVSITSPGDGAIIVDPQLPVVVDIQAADRGFGFSLTVSVDGVVIHEASGAANEDAVEILLFNDSIGSLDVGEHVIRAEVSDAVGNSVTDQVTIWIIPANEAPVANDDTATTMEDTPVLIDVTANDTDVDGNLDPATATVLSGPATGDLINNADGTLSYQPAQNVFGDDSFTYEVCDTDGLCATATVSISITRVNDLPVAVDDNYVMDEDTPLMVAAPGVLGNDSDVDGDSTSVTSNTQPANGSLTVNADGSFNYTPDADYHGNDSFQYTLVDGQGGTDTASVMLTVNAVNDPPVANNDTATTMEDTPVLIDVTANDTDVDYNLDPATVTEPSGQAIDGLTNNGDGTFSYQPNLNVFGADSFSYQVCDTDGLCATATVSISIIPVNDPPEAVDDNYVTDEDTPLMVAAPGVLGNDSDVDIGDSLSVTANSQPANGSLSVNADGSFSYTPNADYYGSDSFQYTIADSQGTTDTATVTLTVYAVNDPPVVSVDLVNQGVQYSDTITAVTVTATDIDSPLLTLSHTWTRDGGATQVGFPRDLAVSESCTLSGVNSSCSWILRGQTLVGAGTYALTFNVDDGTASQATATELVVIQEDASVVFKETNPLAVSVANPGGYSGLFVLAVDVTETQPDKPEAGALPGDISLAEVSMTLEPVGPGPSVSSTCTPANSGSDYDAVQTVTCSFETVPVNTYTAVVSVGGDYYTGAAEDVLTVYDPSLGFTTGGGWFYWPGSEDTTNGYPGDKTNFGYTMKYGKNGNNMKGSLLLIRHLADGTKYRVKSNALTGLAIGQDPTVPFGWASFSGKSTYLEPGMLEPEGNHQFTAYVEDRNEPGSGNDRFWITVRGKDGNMIPVMSIDEPAPDNAQSIQGGNIVAPH